MTHLQLSCELLTRVTVKKNGAKNASWFLGKLHMVFCVRASAAEHRRGSKPLEKLPSTENWHKLHCSYRKAPLNQVNPAFVQHVQPPCTWRISREGWRVWGGGRTQSPAVCRPPRRPGRPTGRHRLCPTSPRERPPRDLQSPPPLQPVAEEARCLRADGGTPWRSESLLCVGPTPSRQGAVYPQKELFRLFSVIAIMLSTLKS